MRKFRKNKNDLLIICYGFVYYLQSHVVKIMLTYSYKNILELDFAGTSIQSMCYFSSDLMSAFVTSFSLGTLDDSPLSFSSRSRCSRLSLSRELNGNPNQFELFLFYFFSK